MSDNRALGGAPSRRLWARKPLLHALTAGTLVAAVLAVLPATARADRHPVHEGVVSADPTDLTPDVLDGRVNAFAQVGSTMIVAGSFTQVGRNSVTYTRHNLFAFNVTTGEISSTFVPRANGEVFDLQLSPDKKTVYAVGDFTAIAGQPGTRRVARIKIANGAVDPRFTSPGLNRAATDIALSHGVYYLTGNFTRVGRKARAYVVALTATGRDTGRADLHFAGTNRGGRTHIRSMDMSANGNLMAVIGNFVTINGQRRPQVALLRITGHGTSVHPWKTERFAPRCGPHFDTYMRGVAFDPAGRYFVIATTGGQKGVQSSGLLCDSLTRWNVEAAPRQQPVWSAYTGGDTLTGVIVDSAAIYVGGHQRWFNNSYGKNSAGRGAVARSGIAALDPANGLPYSWNPGKTRGVGVSGFQLTSAGLWVGHDSGEFGGEAHLRIAFCPIDPAHPLPAYRTARLPGTLSLLGQGSGNTVVTRSFDGAKSGHSRSVLTEQYWQKSRGTFVVDGVLYAGWANGRLSAQTYDGTTLGLPSNVDLHRAFGDLKSVRSMFFDRATHRIYYTQRNSTKMFYRYFQPESQIVGSWRYPVAASNAVRWDRVAGAFVVKHRLYYVDAATGKLHRIGWNPAAAKTTGKAVALPGAFRYRSAGLVLTS